MNDVPVEPRASEAAVLSEEDRIKIEWANALDCGALGPGREEPQLFYQGEDD